MDLQAIAAALCLQAYVTKFSQRKSRGTISVGEAGELKLQEERRAHFTYLSCFLKETDENVM